MRQMKHTFLTALVLALLASGCSPRYYPSPWPDRDEEWEKRDKDRDERDKDWEKRGEGRGDRDGRVFPFSSLNIPKGHLPPPGECKVWFPSKPPGHQPPPQSCASALRSAPLGAWVITHEGSRYKVNIFDRVRRGVIDEVRYYQAQ
ncbi:hypothetical protein POKO110462_16395 [Pontibacter korlensis]|uniref:hypothetical protein n=1 Tax=Pontibacter korlensis TaxID=400092 RepID=UPI000A46BE8F|nr:hypothetical protein [Pontibacter korlensis]